MTRKEKLKFYHSTAWKKKSKEILLRDHYECQECRRRLRRAAAEGKELPAAERKINRATAVHHIIHYEDAPELGLVNDNLEAICAACHNREHDRTLEMYKNQKKKKPVTVERW